VLCTCTECSHIKTIKAPDLVFGLAILDKKLYVLRQRPAKQIYVYNLEDFSLTDDYITIPDFSVSDCGWNDMQVMWFKLTLTVTNIS